MNEYSVFCQLGGRLFEPGYFLGMILGMVGGMGWAIVGEIITFVGLYISLDFILSIFMLTGRRDQNGKK